MHKTIFTWFDNLPTSTELQGFHYYSGKNTSVAIQYFSLSKMTKKKKKILITKKHVFYILGIGFTSPSLCSMD